MSAFPHTHRPWRIMAGIAVVCVLAATFMSGLVAAAAKPSANPPNGATSDCASLTTCFTPHQLDAAYGVLPLLDHGINGRGETVVLPELAEPQFPLPTSDIRKDLAQFDKLFDLPAARLRAVTSLAGSASPWLANGEEVLDTEMVHAVAPGASIVEVPLAATSLNNPASGVAASVAALRLGTALGGIISISAAGQTGGEHCDTRAEVAALHAALQAAAADHVTVVAASGDIGAAGEPCQLRDGLIGGPPFAAVKEVNLPASDPLVLAAGGTSLTASHETGAYISEGAWGLPFGDPGTQFQASGGGLSRVFSRPSYQNDIPGIGAYRGVPDVAAAASPHSGMAVITSTSADSYSISGGGGTSASAPLWAGVVALPTSTPAVTWASSTPPSTASPAAPSTTRRSTTSTTGNNTVSFPPKTDQRATRPHRAGTPRLAGAAPTRACSSPCSLATSTATTPKAYNASPANAIAATATAASTRPPRRVEVSRPRCGSDSATTAVLPLKSPHSRFRQNNCMLRLRSRCPFARHGGAAAVASESTQEDTPPDSRGHRWATTACVLGRRVGS